MAGTAKPWGPRDLKRRCRDLRERLTVLSLATASELAAYWPGGAENAEPGVGGWIYCYSQLARMMGRLETHHQDAQWARANAARADALADVAEPVPLTSGAVVHVHPLSYHALRFLSLLDRTVTRVTALVAQVAARDTDAAERVVALAPLVESHAVRLWAWVLTSGSPALPFADDATDVDAPAWTRTLTPEDLIALAVAHRKIHGQRLALIATLFPSQPQQGQRLTLEGFIGAYANEHGGDAAEYMRRFALGKLFAQAASAAEQADAAKDKAPDPLAAMGA